jgi:hypothetical protein
MVAGGLRSAPKKENIKYLRIRRKFPLRRIQHITNPNEVETAYDKLKQCIEIQAPNTERQAKTLWISSDTWRLIA